AVSPGASSASSAGCRSRDSVRDPVPDAPVAEEVPAMPVIVRREEARASVVGVPVEPPPTIWEFPPSSRFHPDDDLVATGADLEPGTVLTAYRRGLFPMPVGGPRAPMAWFCPVRRGVLRPRELRVSRSLRRSTR